jgi:hypothetical protein
MMMVDGNISQYKEQFVGKLDESWEIAKKSDAHAKITLTHHEGPTFQK